MNQLAAAGETSPHAEVPVWSLSLASRSIYEAMERIEPSFHAWAYDLAAGSRSEIVSMTRLLKNRT
jgi:nitrite reductase/ring-hydroxylating ferredoxin subunit